MGGLAIKQFSKLFGRRADDQSKSPDRLRAAAEDLLKQNRFEEAAPVLVELAQSHDPWGEYWLARLAANGVGLSKDDERALALFRSSAEAGYAPAASALGFMYLEGRGVPRNDREGIVWIVKAAVAGDVAAQFNLAKAYSEGNIVEADQSIAFKWMAKAAEAGLIDARLGVAIWTLVGKGVPADREQAIKLLIPLAAQGHKESRHWLDKARAEDG
jgi:hypothetical protein